MTSESQTPGGHKFAPLVASQRGRANQHEPACVGLSFSWSFPSRSGIPLHAVVQLCFFLQRSILPWNVPPVFRRSASFPLILGCSRPLVGVDAENSEVVQETPHPLFFLAPHTARAPTIYPNITHFGSLVSFMRATNPANKIRLLRKVASMLSLPCLEKRVQIGNRVVGAIVLPPTDAASQEPVVGSAQRVVAARARAPRDAAVRLEYLGS